jgi:hypothetical protein
MLRLLVSTFVLVMQVGKVSTFVLVKQVGGNAHAAASRCEGEGYIKRDGGG